MVTVFRDCSHGFGTHLIWILHFLPPYSPVPFFRRWKLTLKTKKPLSLYGRTAEYRELEVSALFQISSEIKKGAAQSLAAYG